jgi:hypothetical protein
LSLLSFVSIAFGEGTYQQTKDGKTIVWNDNPKPGDTASWFGDRDAEGYATRVGTLTWYTARGTVYARFRGNMVRGKFDGMVNGYSKGKSGHAAFTDGQRTTRWAAGTAPGYGVPKTSPVTTEKIAKTEIAESANSSQPVARAAPSPTNRQREESASQKPAKPTGSENLTRQTASETLTKPATPESARQKLAQPVSTVEPAPLRENTAPNVAFAPEPTPIPDVAVVPQPTITPEPNVAAVPQPAASPPDISVIPEAEPSPPNQDVVTNDVSSPPTPVITPLPSENRPADVIPEAEPSPPNQDVATNDVSSPPTPVITPLPSENRPAEDNFPRVEPVAPGEGPRVVTTNGISTPPTLPVITEPATENAPAPDEVKPSEPEAPAEGPRGTEHAPPAPSAPPANEPAAADKPSVEVPGTENAAENRETGDIKKEVDKAADSAASPPAVNKRVASRQPRPHLTNEEVIKIASDQVRRHGYHRADYRHDEPEFSADYSTWSVSYDPMTVDGTEMAGQHFTVIIDDRTRGAVFVLRK